ncbi:uncharacterized protein DNG_00178 [Cephalotrichum gorgonifer]|uniref:Peptidase S33 tripeptidyl aminopeptidase-like C-terminal domain-containing protein n=1 Tax=Cephalotrichum gorgonifer TaxID=2041049 RepID=A0AAE8MPI6_9PEZI|nr:uncharacterized protein DNG_00178 [Cephalotrichum gorgonifer]
MLPRWSGLTAGLLLTSGALATTSTAEYFDWDSVDPTPELRYHDCYDGHQCARLQVPLDWLNPESNNNTVAIAIVKRPAIVPDSDPTFGGSVLVNPGGPGGSGTGMVLGWGERFQKILAGKKNYEIIGFDPRAIAFTTPRANCYPDELTRAYEGFQAHGSGFLRPDNSKLGWRYALTRAYGKRCEETLGGDGGILTYASTSSVARDMVEIIDRIEELRDEEKARELGAPDAEQMRLGGGQMAGKKKPARLQYLGFSYGTVLGNTFASMFPGRVGRVVLDGVVDIDDHMAGTWSKNLQDSNSAIKYIYQVCFYLGKSCPIADSADASWQDIKARVDDAIAPLEHSPIALEMATSTLPLTDVDVRSLILLSLYKPSALFPFIVSFLSALIEKDHVTLAAIMGTLFPVPTIQGVCRGECSGPTCAPVISTDAQAVIACADGENSGALSLSDWKDYFTQVGNQSSVGAVWAEIRFHCAGWSARPEYRFTGPFSTPEHDPLLVEGKPAAPLLFLSSRIDPVTPLANAFAMSARHPGSSVVTQESVGHCALGTGVSSCTEKIIRTYFEEGTVPKEGAVCEEDCGEFDLCASEEGELAPVSWPTSFGGLPLGRADLGRMQDMGAALMQKWSER